MTGNQAQMVVHRRSPPLLQLPKSAAYFVSGTALGCCVLPSGIMVTSSDSFFDQTITVINPGGTKKSEMKFEYPDCLQDLSVMGNDKIVASFHDTVSVIDLKKNKVVKKLSLSSNIRGISYVDGNIFFCVPQTGIVKRKVNSLFKSESVIKHDANVKYGSSIAASKDRVCYTCPEAHSVTVLDSKYNVLFKFQNTSLLHGPSAVAMDEHMNVYVTGYGSNNIVFISSDSKTVQQLMSKTETLDLENPVAVDYNQNSKQLVVLNQSGWLSNYTFR